MEAGKQERVGGGSYAVAFYPLPDDPFLLAFSIHQHGNPQEDTGSKDECGNANRVVSFFKCGLALIEADLCQRAGSRDVHYPCGQKGDYNRIYPRFEIEAQPLAKAK